ncbi:Ig-like domain repeat protein [Glaciihabitans sp. dw_435]|uniref:Ig-like domain repeat protein n=1 Tax=Glaciihabitans sp. dw_435 TaxID=2720081 RepID=UPI001BD66A02|nr:Ig-like domain repeat protein [Glaciihabitans sp. dw_435]
MKVTTFSKFTVSVCAAALIVGGFAAPAMADPGSSSPFGKLVGLGSDTTQDVMNGIAALLPAGAMASYDAIGTDTVTTRAGSSVTTPRASGSGAGINVLRVAIGQTATATITRPSGVSDAATAANSVGYIDFARSSSGPATTDVTSSGVLTYVPFAKDAVSVAVNPGSALSKIPNLILGDSTTAGSTVASLYNIYRGDVAYVYLNADATYNSVGKTSTGPTGTTANKIQALLPKAGSGTRSYFIGKLNLTETDITGLKSSGVIKDTFGSASAPVEEHDGTALVGDATAIVPFSVSQWIAQANAVTTDRRHGVSIATLNAVAPATLATSKYTLNPAYSAMVRNVYNVVPSNLVDDPASDVAKTFVGTGSLVCSQTAAIERYGFGLLTGAGNIATACGNTLTRAYVASASSTTFALSSPSTTVGTPVTATANVVSTNNGGGTVQFKSGGVLVGIAAVANGATTAATTITPTTAGSLPVTATFIPALPGVAASTSAAQTIIASTPVVTPPPAPTATKSAVTISAIGTKPTVGKVLPIAITVVNPSAAAGVVQLRSGGTLVAKMVIPAGKGKVVVSFVPKTVAYKLTAYYTPAAGSSTIGSSSAVKTVPVAKATAVIKVGAIKSVSAKAKAKVTVVVAAPGVVTSGTITIKQGSKVLVSKAAFKGSTGTFTLPKLKKGNHTLTVVFNGSPLVNAASKTGIVVKIKK